MLGPGKRCWVRFLFQSCVHYLVVLQKCGAVCSISVHSLAVCCESDTPSHAAKPRLPPLLHLLSCHHQLLYWVSPQIVYLSCRYWSLLHVNSGLHMYTHTHAHTVMQILISVTCRHRFIHGHTHTHADTDQSVSHVDRFTHAHTCTHVHTYAYTYIQVHTHAHTYMVVIAGQVSTGWYVYVTTAQCHPAASLVSVEDVTPTLTVTSLVVVTGVSTGCWVCNQST